jgi:hypothetical protein
MRKESKRVRFNDNQEYEKSSNAQEMKGEGHRNGSEGMVDMRDKMLMTNAGQQNDAFRRGEPRKGSA